jgi:hypothetical protein
MPRKTPMPAGSSRLLATLCSALVLACNSARADDTPPGECSPVLAASEVQAGQRGTGWTVVQGTAPQPFDVTILGVLTNGISSGHDLAIIEIADKPGSHFIADAGGIWAGMSGSPVYIDGKLAGAVSYTFSQGPSKIGGMTLAEDMLGILSYGAHDEVVPLTAEARAAVEQHLGASLASPAVSFSRIPLPIHASGIASSTASNLQTMLAEQGLRGFVVPGATAAAPTDETHFERAVPGGNFSAAASYGDLSLGSLGTVSYVCEDKILAFGHPFTLRGTTTFGAHAATAFAIVDDPTLGPFKLGAMGAPYGLLDQDRIAAIGATAGLVPELLPVTARLRSMDLDRERTGTTYVTMPVFMRSIATSHLLDNVVAVTDSEAGGTAALRWTIRGKRSSGQPFEMRHSDRVSSKDSVALAAGFRLLLELGRLEENGFEDVEFSAVTVRGRVRATPREDQILQVEVSTNGGPFDVVESRLTVAPGDELTLRTALRKPNALFRMLETQLTIPADASGSGRIVVAGGSDFGITDCSTYPDSCARAFPELLEVLEATPRADEVVTQMSLSSRPGQHSRATVRHRAVVRGRVTIDLAVAD